MPDAAREAAEIAAPARLSGRPTGVYRLDDLLLEYQLTRPGPARDRLAGGPAIARGTANHWPDGMGKTFAKR